MKNKVVIFFKTNAKLIVNPTNLENLIKLENVLINPDLSQVRNTPTHFWKQVGYSVMPMTRPEKLIRLAEIEKFGLDNCSQELDTVQLHADLNLIEKDEVKPSIPNTSVNVWKNICLIENVLLLIGLVLWML